MKNRIQTVVILGAGPAASTLAILLARMGICVIVLHKPKHTSLMVGESLLPAIIPMLRELGVEDEVRGYSLLKPGATINFSETVNFMFAYSQLRGRLPKYSYNVPRERFDDTLLNAAKQAGAVIIEAVARAERIGNEDRVRLDAATMKLTERIFPGQPDLIIDATGRVRLLPNLLKIPSTIGIRKDTALFAHVDNTYLDNEGHIHATRMDYGWSWRIPLPTCISVGMVIPEEHLLKYGITKEERYDNMLRQDSVLAKIAKNTKRISPVMEYTNYQLVSTRLTGNGWALVGDTAGFIDPIFSSGVFVGMESAFHLAKAIRKGTSRSFQHYESKVLHHLKCWHEFVNYYYDGRLFTAFLVGKKLENNPIIKLLSGHFTKHFGGIFTGAASSSHYSRRLLHFVVRHSLKNEDPKEMAIR
jgi:flavin-dependent dehydrogenase